MIEEIIFRPLRKDDALQIYEVALEAWKFTYREIFEMHFIENFVNRNYAPKVSIRLLPRVEGDPMQLQLIRNATMRIIYANRLFDTDPFLAAKHSIHSFSNISPNPLVELPCTPEYVLDGIEMALISHLHTDHFDPLAEEMLPKDLPLFCQPGDEKQLAGKGFTSITVVDELVNWQGITLTRTPGQHGSGEWIERMGKVSGFIIQADGEPTVYWMGDTIWYKTVEQVIQDTQPDVIITHSSGAKFGDSDPIVMDVAQTITVCKAAPQATIIAIHLETLDHGTVSRADLRTQANAEGIPPERLLIPDDGESIEL